MADLNILPHLPNAERAEVDIRKLTNYCLDATHSKGGSDKAWVFASALGLYQEHGELLRQAILEAVLREVAFERERSEYGARYTVYFAMTGPNGKTTVVTTGWLVATGTDYARMTSCYVETD